MFSEGAGMNGKRRCSIKRVLAALGLMACCLLVSCSREVNFTPPVGSRDMAITHYAFGEMVIDGKTYENDLTIGPNQTVKYWETKLRHYIELSDVADLIDDSTRTLIVGIGSEKQCEVGNSLIEYAKSKGIELLIFSTYEAVKRFNALPKKGLSACFHLNC